MLQTCSKLMIFVHYQLNKEAITREFCENKSLPQMHCNGKCHLAKQLKKVDTEESKNHSSKSNSPEVFNLFAFRFSSLFLPSESSGIAISFFYSDNYSFQYSDLLFHPPTV
jgi:hypothetical protein